MAQYRCSIKARIGRAKGGSVVRAASYIAREKIDNTRTGETFDFSKHKDGALWVGIFAPQNVPEWARDVSQLANEIEKAEKYKNAQLALPIELSLAHELTLEQNRWMLQDFVKENFTRKGYATIAAIHEPPEHGDDRNIHAHLLVSLRKIDENGFAPTKAEQQKNYLKRRERVEELRQSWEHHLKRHLARHNFVREAEEVSCKSLDAQGIDREATKHLGPVAAYMESEGQQTELGDKNREIEARNKERERLKIDARTVARELAEAEKDRREDREAAAAKQAQALWREQASSDLSAYLHGTNSGEAFRQLAEQNGFCLAQSDHFGIVAVDRWGNAYNFSEQMAWKLEDIDRDSLLTVQEAKREQKERLAERQDHEAWDDDEESGWKKKPKTREPYSEAGMVAQQRDAQRDFEKRSKKLQVRQVKQRRKEQRENNAFADRKSDAEQKREDAVARTEKTDAKREITEAQRARMERDAERKELGLPTGSDRKRKGGRRRERDWERE